MNVSIDIPQAEVNRLLKSVRAWQVRKRAEILALIEETTEAIAAETETRVPVQSGNLKKKIRTALRDVAAQLSGFVVVDDFYAKFVELGTSAAAAHPFIMPAYEIHITQFITKLYGILKR